MSYHLLPTKRNFKFEMLTPHVHVIFISVLPNDGDKKQQKHVGVVFRMWITDFFVQYVGNKLI